jgi:hypothetical protein
MPFVIEYGIPMEPALLQQDCARPHSSNVALRFLHVLLEERVLSNQHHALFDERLSWSLVLLDLNPCDHVLWGYLVERVFQKNPHTLREMKTGIQSETEAVFA